MVLQFKDGIKKLKTDLEIGDKTFKDVIIADYSLEFLEGMNESETLDVQRIYSTYNEIFRFNDNKDEILEEFKKFSPDTFLSALATLLEELQKKGK